MGQRSHLTITW